MSVRRVYGTETEFSIVIARKNELVDGRLCYDVPDQDELKDIVQGCLPKSVDGLPEHLPSAVYRGASAWLYNGGKWYLDVQHVEYATPEAANLDDLVASEYAGERLCFLALENAVKQGYFKAFSLNKRCVDKDGTSWGYHENYLVRRSALDPSQFEAKHTAAFNLLALHLATRNIYCGAGMVRDGKFYIAQKASVLTCDYSEATVTSKPLINLRDEPHANSNDYVRLHVTSADPHMSPWATKISVGTTELIISMIEDGVKLDANWQLGANELHKIARIVAGDPTCKAPIQCENGSTTSALEIQNMLLQKAKHWAAGRTLTIDQQFALREWGRACQQISQNPLLLHDRAEWPARLAMLERYIHKSSSAGKDIGWDSPEVAERDLAWDRIDSPLAGTPGNMMRARIWKHWMPAEELILERMVQAPPDTRANARSKLIKALGHAVHLAVDWGRVEFRLEPGDPLVRIPLPDPLSTTYEKRLFPVGIGSHYGDTQDLVGASVY